MKNKWLMMILAASLITSSCEFLIGEDDILPKRDNVEVIKTDDPPAQGGKTK